MKMNAEVLRKGIEDLAFGVTNDQIDELLHRASKSDSQVQQGLPRRRPALFSDQMATIGQARAWVYRADALQDPDVVKVRSLTEHQRAATFAVAEQIETWVPWDGVLSRDELVLPPTENRETRAISITSLEASNHRFASLAPWFAWTALKLSVEYQIRPEYAFGFTLLDSFWRPIPSIEAKVERFGKSPRQSRIYLDIDPFTPEEEVLSALRAIKAQIGLDKTTTKKRELRQKTIALAMLLAFSLSEPEISPSLVDWDALLELWNVTCTIDDNREWMYLSSDSLSRPVHQFARDAKNAFAAVRDEATPYPILGVRKRKPVS